MDIHLKQKIDHYLAQEEEQFFKDELLKAVAQDNLEELNDRFYRDLEFGTAGLRGIIAGGLNRMNNYVIKQTTQGLAGYMLRTYKEPSAVIAYDCRIYSTEFAQLTARVLASNGIKVYLFESLRPTPALAFATVQLKANIGIMITASHNPPEYNGYKVFQGDGSQIISPVDKEILAEIAKAKTFTTPCWDELYGQGKIEILSEKMDNLYFEMAQAVPIQKELFLLQNTQKLKVVYTPLHGTGKAYIEHLFKKMNINYVMVKEQAEADGHFPTVSYPNPEETKGMAMALALAEKEQANIVIANDPDSDRMALAYRESNGEYVCLNGHQVGALFADYIITAHKLKKNDISTGYIVKSIVTGDLERKIAEGHGIPCHDVLTGFKWIANQIRQEGSSKNFLFGNEEAIGYLVEKAVRDKDGVTAALMAVEMALFYQSKDQTLGDHLDELYKQHGYFEDSQISQNYPGEQGVATMKKLMEALRTQGLKKIGSLKVVQSYDFLTAEIKDDNGQVIATLPYEKNNMLRFVMENGSKLSVRPSGTEPKIKFYISSVVPNYQTKADRAKAQSFYNDVKSLIEHLTAG